MTVTRPVAAPNGLPNRLHANLDAPVGLQTSDELLPANGPCTPRLRYGITERAYIDSPRIYPEIPDERRLPLTPAWDVRYQLKSPYRDGATHVIFEPLDFMARLAALVP